MVERVGVGNHMRLKALDQVAQHAAQCSSERAAQQSAGQLRTAGLPNDLINIAQAAGEFVVVGLRVAQQGKDARIIQQVSHLNPAGFTVQLFTRLGDGDSRTPVTETRVGS